MPGVPAVFLAASCEAPVAGAEDFPAVLAPAPFAPEEVLDAVGAGDCGLATVFLLPGVVAWLGGTITLILGWLDPPAFLPEAASGFFESFFFEFAPVCCCDWDLAVDEADGSVFWLPVCAGLFAARAARRAKI